MTESSLPYPFGGSSMLDFHDGGIECIIDIELPSSEISIVGGSQA